MMGEVERSSSAAAAGWSVGNRYWILRHGKSVPNEKGIIVSSMKNGSCTEYGLALEGVNQAISAGGTLYKELQHCGIEMENVRICYSPFSRTVDTANSVAGVMDIPFDGPQCKVIPELRERYFGPAFELQSHDKYADIWALDIKDPFLPPEGGESVADVASRLAGAVATIEAEFQGCAILLVSHGDPLQIFQAIVDAAKQTAGFGNQNRLSSLQEVAVASVLSQHRKYALNTGELRRLI